MSNVWFVTGASSGIGRAPSMASPPRQFFAGSDAVAGITDDLQARLAEVQRHKALSSSTDGTF